MAKKQVSQDKQVDETAWTGDQGIIPDDEDYDDYPEELDEIKN